MILGMAPVDDLRAALGDAAVLTGADDLDRYERPARGAAGRAAFVVRPASTDEVRSVLRWAWEHNVRLVPQGANSGLVGASVPDSSGTVGVLSTERLTSGLVVDPAGRTAVVPAGVRLSALEDALAPHGLTFPIDLGADPTIGGMAATNTGGSRVLAYGDVRRRVLGVEVVLADADATVLDLLTTLRKDNSRMALHQLFVGSGGSLGIITKVAVDVVVRPTHQVTWWVVPASDAAVLDLLDHFERAADGGARLTAFELLSGPALAAGLSRLDAGANPFAGGAVPDTVLLVELSGGEGTDDAFVVALERAPSGSVADARAVPAARSWAVRHAVTEGLRARGEVVGFDVSAPRSTVLVLRDEARRMVTEQFPGVELCEFGHMGDGSLHLNVVLPGGGGGGAIDVAALRAAMYALVARHGGSFSAEHGIGPSNAAQWRAATPPAVQDLTERLVRLFDPRGLLGHPALPYRHEGTHP
ncbi:MAG TPA: FAD-binding oxidoreductase [Acidimicrobiales bacterium]|nr:FAD-binding oxidoreductase [Acidimicrobiales bacterium]